MTEWTRMTQIMGIFQELSGEGKHFLRHIIMKEPIEKPSGHAYMMSLSHKKALRDGFKRWQRSLR